MRRRSVAAAPRLTDVATRDPSNASIADALEELGDLYELDGAIVHRVLAYRTAAKSVREASVSVAALAREGRASELPGIGATLQEKILALAQDGTIPASEKLRAKFPPGLIAVTRLPGLGRQARPSAALRARRGLAGEAARGGARAAHQDGSRPGTEARGTCACGARARRRRAPRGARAAAQGDRDRREPGGGPGRARWARNARADRRLSPTIGRQRQGHRPDRRDHAADHARQERGQAGGDRERRLGRQGGRTGAHALGRRRRPADRQARRSWATCCSTSPAPGAHNAALREAAVQARAARLGVRAARRRDRRARAPAPARSELYELLGLAYIEPELRENRGELDAARLQAGSGCPS